jgi:hypothetical protein
MDHYHHNNKSASYDVFHRYCVTRADERTHDYRISSALRGLDQVAIDRFDGDHDSLDHDSLAALAAALQCVGQQGVAGALYRVRLVVAPSIEHAQRAIVAPEPMLAAASHARTHHGLVSLYRVGRRITSDDVRVCALARLLPAPPLEAQQASAVVFAAGGGVASPPPPVLSCEWQNLFRPSSSSMRRLMLASSAPFYFFPKQETQGPPFMLYRGATTASFFQEEEAEPESVRGCVWGVVVNPDCTDPDDGSNAFSEFDEPDLGWPAQMCVTSALAEAVEAGFEPPRFLNTQL